MSDLQLTILGSSSAMPVTAKSPTSQFLTLADRHFLIDCGEGTQMRLRENNIGFGRIQHIFISHLHGDHFYGLVPLLSTLHLLDREKPLHIYAPAAAEETVYHLLKHSGGRIRYPLHFHHLPKGKKSLMYEDKALTVHAFPLEHRMDCFGFLFAEKPRPRNMRREKLEEYNIPVAEIRQIKAGADWIDENGRKVNNKELTLNPPPPLAYAFCTDTLPLDLQKYLPPVHLLYHEATFKEEHRERAGQTYHTTARQAAQVAQQAQAKHLLLGHFSVRYGELDSLLEEAREVFEHSYLAQEGNTFTVKSSHSGVSLQLEA